jgi:hypothetical protein
MACTDLTHNLTHVCLAALQVVVDAFDPSVLVSDCATRVFDFMTMKEEELHDIQIPLDLLVGEYVTSWSFVVTSVSAALWHLHSFLM